MTDTMNFAPEYDVPLDYMRRTRDYYLALGYDNPYRWAHYVDTPFTPLKKPLKDSVVALVTTSAHYQPDKGDQGPGAAYNAAAKFYTVYSGDTSLDHDVRVSHVAIDRKHSSMEDSGCWFPLPLLRQFGGGAKAPLQSPSSISAPTARMAPQTLPVLQPMQPSPQHYAPTGRPSREP